MDRAEQLLQVPDPARRLGDAVDASLRPLAPTRVLAGADLPLAFHLQQPGHQRNPDHRRRHHVEGREHCQQRRQLAPRREAQREVRELVDGVQAERQAGEAAADRGRGPTAPEHRERGHQVGDARDQAAQRAGGRPVGLGERRSDRGEARQGRRGESPAHGAPAGLLLPGQTVRAQHQPGHLQVRGHEGDCVEDSACRRRQARGQPQRDRAQDVRGEGQPAEGPVAHGDLSIGAVERAEDQGQHEGQHRLAQRLRDLNRPQAGQRRRHPVPPRRERAPRPVRRLCRGRRRRQGRGVSPLTPRRSRRRARACACSS